MAGMCKDPILGLLGDLVLDSEERRLYQARNDIPDIACALDFVLEQFVTELKETSSRLDDVVSKYSAELKTATMQTGIRNEEIVDDRVLYWARLLAKTIIQAVCETERHFSTPDLEKLRKILEWETRRFSSHPTETQSTDSGHILLTGFDPFQLEKKISQSNPSAVVALSLQNASINQIPIEVLIFPVRYQDFDEGCVELEMERAFRRNPVLALTLSMGRDRFDLERFPGCARSSTVPDNQNIHGVVKGEHRRFATNTPEFVEFTLPAEAMCNASGPWEVHDNHSITTVRSGKIIAKSLDALANEHAIEGSGGGFLSNEISYRSLMLHKQLNANFPLGHLHLPKIEEFNPVELNAMTQQTLRVIEHALEATSAMQVR